MSVKQSFAETEFSTLEKLNDDSGILLLKEEIYNLLSKFSDSGQSGYSAPYAANAISFDIRRGLKGDLLIEMRSDPNSMSADFIKETNELCSKIKELGLEKKSENIISKIRDLCLFKPLAPLTGFDEEWGEVSFFEESGKTWFQNKRLSALFKEGNDGKPYYIDALIKRDEKGVCWSGMAWLSEEDYRSGDRSKMIGKRGYVKSFPFTPKTFYMDVRDVEVTKDDWESFVVDPSQLEGFLEYYDKY